MTLRIPGLALMALAAPLPAQAQAFQSTALIDTIVAQFTGAAIGTPGGALASVDARLKLAACPAPQLEWRTPAHDAVVVRCLAPQWRLFVPVGVVKVAKAEAAPASPAPAPAAKPEVVIRRGDAITIEAGGAGFAITREGVAMADAPAGGRLAVKIDDKKPPVQAIAIEPGRARLPGWGS